MRDNGNGECNLIQDSASCTFDRVSRVIVLGESEMTAYKQVF